MKCQKCGTEFLEGIFCPECGFKNIDENSIVIDKMAEVEKQRLIEKEQELQEREARLREQELLAQEQQKKEQDQISRERAEEEKRCQKEEQERAEAERIAKEKAEAERLAKEQEEAERKEREYKEAEKRRQDNELIEALKNQLTATKSQEERRNILEKFTGTLNCEDSVQRLQYLKDKANQEPPLGNRFNWIFGATIILAIIITGILGSTGNADSPFLIITAIWYGIGIPVWIVWRIVLIVQSKSKNYYLNIKHI